MSGVDLHAHTTASDGTYTPVELVDEAVRRGLRVLAITDHDSTEAVAPALAAAYLHPGLQIVPGIEINTEVEGTEVHVLGFFLDHEAAWLRATMREFRGERAARITRITERLAALGMPVDPGEILARVREGSAGRPHVAQVMVEKGYVATVRDAFDRYLRSGGPAYVPHRKLTVREACAMIQRAGGLAVMAHPGFHAGADALVRALAAERLLNGVECYYAEHTPEQTAGFLALCRELDLVATGGSDFHGPAVRAATLGQPSVPWAAWEALRRRAGR